MSTGQKQKYKRVAVDQATGRKIEQYAKRTKLKHIHVVGTAMDALLERDAHPQPPVIGDTRQGQNAVAAAAP